MTLLPKLNFPTFYIDNKPVSINKVVSGDYYRLKSFYFDTLLGVLKIKCRQFDGCFTSKAEAENYKRDLQRIYNSDKIQMKEFSENGKIVKRKVGLFPPMKFIISKYHFKNPDEVPDLKKEKKELQTQVELLTLKVEKLSQQLKIKHSLEK